jgi:ankyrin repeat protein
MTADWSAARQHGDLRALERLLAAGTDINGRDEHGQTAVMCAARDGQLEVVKFLIDRGALLDDRAKHNLTALMLAVIGGHAQIARALVEAGADVTVKGTGAPGFAGKTARDLANEREDVDLRRLFE